LENCIVKRREVWNVLTVIPSDKNLSLYKSAAFRNLFGAGNI